MRAIDLTWFPPRSLVSAWIERLQKCTCHVYNHKPGQLYAIPGVAIQVTSSAGRRSSSRVAAAHGDCRGASRGARISFGCRGVTIFRARYPVTTRTDRVSVGSVRAHGSAG